MPTDTLSIVTLGTSLTASIDWQTPLAAHLSAHLDRRVSIVAVAAGGVTSRWGLAQVDRVAALRPAVVLVEFAINDANWRRFVSRAESRANTRRILRDLRTRLPYSRPILMVTNPVHGLRGAMRPTVGAYYEQYRLLAAEEQVGLIDAEPAWAALSLAERRRLIPDGVHPTLAGFVDVALPAIARAVLAELTRPSPPGA